MFPNDVRTGGGVSRALLLAAVLILALIFAFPWPSRPVLSRWGGGQFALASVPNIIATAVAPEPPAGIVGLAAPQTLGLERYNQGSQLLDSEPGGDVQHYRRELPGGTLSYFVVKLGPRVHVEVINADGATPGSDATGDTIWTDGQKHLATVA